jgi:hypothetical protein
MDVIGGFDVPFDPTLLGRFFVNNVKIKSQ